MALDVKNLTNEQITQFLRVGQEQEKQRAEQEQINLGQFLVRRFLRPVRETVRGTEELVGFAKPGFKLPEAPSRFGQLGKKPIPLPQGVPPLPAKVAGATAEAVGFISTLAAPGGKVSKATRIPGLARGLVSKLGLKGAAPLVQEIVRGAITLGGVEALQPGTPKERGQRATGGAAVAAAFPFAQRPIGGLLRQVIGKQTTVPASKLIARVAKGSILFGGPSVIHVEDPDERLVNFIIGGLLTALPVEPLTVEAHPTLTPGVSRKLVLTKMFVVDQLVPES